MRWTPGGTSRNIEDRRGQSGGGGGGGMGRLGVGGVAVLLVLSLVFGRDFLSDAGGLEGGGATATSAGDVATLNETPKERELVQFVSFVLDDVQHTWSDVLPRHGSSYRDAKLVLFREAVRSGCGAAESAMGPFYCPVDERVYLDLGFFSELDARFGAAGDFAQAYVIAHELGHHVQHILGMDARVRQMQETRPASANELSVRLELQADCFAGVWGSSTGQRRLLEQGDVEEGLSAAAAVGDDRLQRAATGTVHPESFTHGSSAQRVEWFKRGLQSGDPKSCDTFSKS